MVTSFKEHTPSAVESSGPVRNPKTLKCRNTHAHLQLERAGKQGQTAYHQKMVSVLVVPDSTDPEASRRTVCDLLLSVPGCIRKVQLSLSDDSALAVCPHPAPEVFAQLLLSQLSRCWTFVTPA